MTFLVRTTQKAEGDVERTASWIRRHNSSESASRWVARIRKAILSLSHRPERCPEADEAASLGLDLRVLLSGKKPHVYRILFTISKDTVIVYRVLLAARDWLQSDDL